MECESTWTCEPCVALRVGGEATTVALNYHHPRDPDAYCDTCGQPVPDFERRLLVDRELAARPLPSPVEGSPRRRGKYATPDDLANELGVSVGALYDRKGRGLLPKPVSGNGRKLLWRWTDVDAFLGGGK